MLAAAESHQIDQQYSPFKPFEEWLDVPIDDARWTEMRSRIQAFTGANPELLERAQRIARRAAAVETGAIEDLYKTDRGVTMTIATEAAGWESAVNGTGEPAIIRDQLDAYEGLLDLATKRFPFTEAGIRDLHTRLCKSQQTYLVQTSIGPQKQKLEHGKYKDYPNHVRKGDGTYHAYAPVDMVAPEMHRLVGELESEPFRIAHPVLQSAYSHHAFVSVHPFPDGNGRVSRALASVFLYRDARVPFLFFFDQRMSYYNALSAADRGSFGAWVTFVMEAGLQTMLLVEQTFVSAAHPEASESVRAIEALYLTRSGLTHEQVDAGAASLASAISEGLKEKLDTLLSGKGYEYGYGVSGGQVAQPPSGYRHPLAGPAFVNASVTNQRPPANAKHGLGLQLFVPKNPRSGDSILLIGDPNQSPFRFEARIDELIPKMATSVAVRVRALVEGMVNNILENLAKKAREKASGA